MIVLPLCKEFSIKTFTMTDTETLILTADNHNNDNKTTTIRNAIDGIIDIPIKSKR